MAIWRSLRFFIKKIIHDYNNVDCPGVKKAVTEFFKNNLHFVVDIADTQAMIIKT